MKASLKVLCVPIGYLTVSGNECPQDGVYLSTNDNHRTICRKGEFIPQRNGFDVTYRLEAYW